MNPVEVFQGSSPVILAFPHSGTFIPSEIWNRLNDNGRMLADTDWHIDKLYEGLIKNATTVRATFHRYCIDANRDPTGVSLYPGQNTTGLVPETDFDGLSIWKDGLEPSEKDISQRLDLYHKPYHEALTAEIQRVKALNGSVIVYDCHSIRSLIPFLFEGKLPDINIGTNNGTSCASEIERTTSCIVREAKEYTAVLNGRFKGGWTTRHYGQPETGVHAIQIELAQCSYLESEFSPFHYDTQKAKKLRSTLKSLLQRMDLVAHTLKPRGNYLDVKSASQ